MSFFYVCYECSGLLRCARNDRHYRAEIYVIIGYNIYVIIGYNIYVIIGLDPIIYPDILKDPRLKAEDDTLYRLKAEDDFFPLALGRG